jgi:hypothetical protein
VETGRRDGRVSFEYDANNDVPGPNNTIVDLKIYFSFKGLGWKDIVVLSGNSITISSNELYVSSEVQAKLHAPGQLVSRKQSMN